MISYIQSFFPPERSRKIMGRFRGIGANIVGALLGTVTPFCSCSSIPIFMGFTIGGWNEGFDPFYGAPVVLIVLANKDVPTYIYDGSLVMGNLMNAAESLGVASIWIHRAKEEFDSEFGKDLLKKLGVEGNFEGIGHCALGYAAEPAKDAAPRKENYVYYVE
ncbi:MAG: permease [Butyrivibrio hungatei]|nr:permease [Butyrivibrio hungatei]